MPSTQGQAGQTPGGDPNKKEAAMQQGPRHADDGSTQPPPELACETLDQMAELLVAVSEEGRTRGEGGGRCTRHVCMCVWQAFGVTAAAKRGCTHYCALGVAGTARLLTPGACYS